MEKSAAFKSRLAKFCPIYQQGVCDDGCTYQNTWHHGEVTPMDFPLGHKWKKEFSQFLNIRTIDIPKADAKSLPTCDYANLLQVGAENLQFATCSGGDQKLRTTIYEVVQNQMSPESDLGQHVQKYSHSVINCKLEEKTDAGQTLLENNLCRFDGDHPRFLQEVFKERYKCIDEDANKMTCTQKEAYRRYMEMRWTEDDPYEKSIDQFLEALIKAFCDNVNVTCRVRKSEEMKDVLWCKSATARTRPEFSLSLADVCLTTIPSTNIREEKIALLSENKRYDIKSRDVSPQMVAEALAVIAGTKNIPTETYTSVLVPHSRSHYVVNFVNIHGDKMSFVSMHISCILAHAMCEERALSQPMPVSVIFKYVSDVSIWHPEGISELCQLLSNMVVLSEHMDHNIP